MLDKIKCTSCHGATKSWPPNGDTGETYGEVYPAEEMEESFDDNVGLAYTVKKGTTTPSDNKYIDLLKSDRPQLHSLGLILNDLCRINTLVAGDYMVGGGHA